MSAKYFCDFCDAELTDANRCSGATDGIRLGGERQARGSMQTRISVEVMTARNGVWNSGDFCKYCVIDAVNSLDDRPRSAK